MRHRDGSVLVATLLGVLLLDIIALGGLAVAHTALRSASIRAQVLQARLQAESAAAETLADWTALGLDTLEQGHVAHHTAADGRTDVERAGGGFVLRGYARTAPERPRIRLRVFSISPDRLEHILDAALHTAGAVRVEPGGTVDGSGMVCTDGTSPRAGLIAPVDAAAIAPGAILAGTPPRTTMPAETVQIEGLPILRFARLADVHMDGIVTPAPRTTGDLCVPADDNWGDPAGGVCASRVPVIAASGDLTMAGGRGQGVLLVPGTLRMIGGARFEGVVFAGAIDIGDAEIRGAVRTLGSDPSTIAGAVRFDGCAVSRALHSDALRRPYIRGRFRVPTP